ncbi:MAG: acyl-CoA thioesterase [Betaproteobacteria bacterium]|nr:acyl-CoA thioesterase [Betaproteobacteria bacterium]
MSGPQFRSVVAVFACQVHWGDCDPAGIIFYPTYFRWMDAACWAMFAGIGYDAKRMRAEHLAMPLVSADCRFLYPAEQGNHCEVHSRIEHFGGKSFTVAHEVLREDGMALARGAEKRVWAKFENGPGTRLRGLAIPAELKALLGGA